MNLNLNNSYINKNAFENRYKKSQRRISHQNSISFTGRGKEYQAVQKFIQDNGYKDAGAIINQIDKALGHAEGTTEGYFTHLLKKAGVENLNIPKYNVLEGLSESLKNIFDIFNSGFHKLTKGKYWLSQARANEKERYAAMNQVREIFEYFQQCAKDGSKFNTKVASEIATLAKNYETKDERTLNRIATSLVSTWFSANDFYNISMLQKDDKKEAEKAGKTRRNQELTRMAISASLTYLTLGVFDRSVKNFKLGTPLVIGLSTLASEVFSRMLNGVKLTPLSPKQAEKIAKKKKEEQKLQTQQNTQAENIKQDTHTSLKKEGVQNIAFQNIYKNSAQGSAYDMLIKNISNEKTPVENTKKEKKSGIKTAVLFLLAVSNIFFWVCQHKKGDKKIGELIQDKYERFTRKTTPIDTKKIIEYVNKMKNNEKGKDIIPILDEYMEFVESSKNAPMEYIQKRPFVSGLIDGILKIPKTIYTIFSIPSKGISHIMEHMDKEKTLNSLRTDEDVVGEKITKEKIKALGMLNSLINENVAKTGKSSSDTIDNLINDVKKNTRNLKVNQGETGELANISRTIVTAISTYFFVNDYRNKVLLESEGKDIKGANAEASERCAHKAANFVINGTLMNLGNSIFRGPLNASLRFATILPFFTEILNESLIRKFICQPIGKMDSRQAIIDYETKKMQSKGLGGIWSRTFKKLTGKKSLLEKTGIKTQQQVQQKH